MSADSNLVFNNRYLTLKQLGHGGFGCTYLAVDTHLPSKPKCVVKQLSFETDDPDLYELIQLRFQREAAILEMLGNLTPQIPKLYACSQEGNKLYLVQDWVDGESLEDKFEGGPLSEDEVTDILAGLLPVLDLVHSKNIIHRDIKPANIMVQTQDNKPVLIDFGAVKEVISETAGLTGDYKTSIFIGTPPFAPIEQHYGKPVFATDLYSLGLTAVCLLTGKRPAWKETDLDTGKVFFQKLRAGTWHNFAPGVSKALQTALDKAIQPTASDRFHTAREMLAALRLRRSSGPRALPTSPSSGLDRLHTLAEKYNGIREAYQDQDTAFRRELMTGVFSEMVEMSLKEDSLNVRPYLNSENWGLRLATYVYIYSHAHPSVLLELIDSTEQAGQQPFVQHRGIEAIGKILEGSNREPEVVEGVERLRALPGRLGSHTLRHAELNRILQKFDDVSAGRNSNEVAGLD